MSLPSWCSPRTGTPLAEIEAVLAAAGQWLSFDPPQFAPGGTIGGAVASGLSGPTRLGHGTVRDAILGVVPPDQALAAVSEAVRQKIDEAVRSVVMRAFDCAIAILRANRGRLEQTAQALLVQGTLEESEIEALLSDLSHPPCVAEQPTSQQAEAEPLPSP